MLLLVLGKSGSAPGSTAILCLVLVDQNFYSELLVLTAFLCLIPGLYIIMGLIIKRKSDVLFLHCIYKLFNLLPDQFIHDGDSHWVLHYCLLKLSSSGYLLKLFFYSNSFDGFQLHK